jgi:ATP-dependent Lon protease
MCTHHRGKGKERVTVTPLELTEMLGPKKYFADELLPDDEIVLPTVWRGRLSEGDDAGGVLLCLTAPHGKLELTGHLGDVMKESAHAAISFLRSHSDSSERQGIFIKTATYMCMFRKERCPKTAHPRCHICTAMLSALTAIPCVAMLP